MSEKKKKVYEWMKNKRHYIVLALCIATVGATYLLFKTAAGPQLSGQLSLNDSTLQPPQPQPTTPLPDLADYFPPEAEPKANKDAQKQTPMPTAPAETKKTQTQSIPTASEPKSVEKQPQRYTLPVNGDIQKAFSGNTLVFSETMSDWRIHSGIDITAQSGTDVRACANGIIEDIYTDDRMGITIVIDHQNGIRSVYSNLSSGLLVEVGQKVSGGEVISAVGASALFEAADESHLHFEMTKDGEHIDPQSLLE